MTNPVPEHATGIARWEARLNGSTSKEQLIARYLEAEPMKAGLLDFNRLDHIDRWCE